MNREVLMVLSNPNQGDRKKVLCACSAGVLRSPTAAHVLAVEYGYNTRSCGLDPAALIYCEDELLLWADEIVVMDKVHEMVVKNRLMNRGLETIKEVTCLRIPDDFEYRDPVLEDMILERYKDAHNSN